MPFESYLVDPYDHTHENIIYRDLETELEKKFKDKDELLVLIGNISIRNAHIDAMIIKNGYWGVIDFKNYKGNLVANEMGEWKIDSTIVEGGSYLNPYQQINAYRKNVMNFYDSMLKEYFIKINNPINITHFGAIVLFHENINVLINNFSHKPFFKIYDFNHFIKHIDTLRSASMNLNNDNIRFILEKLNLDSKKESSEPKNNETNITDIEPEYLLKYIENDGLNSSNNDTPRTHYYEYDTEGENKLENDITTSKLNDDKNKDRKSHISKYLILIPLILIFLWFYITYESDNMINSEQEPIKISAIYLNSNYNHATLKNIIEASSIYLFSKDSNFVLDAENISILENLTELSVENNFDLLQLFFRKSTKYKYDSLFIIGDLGNLKNKKIDPSNKDNYVLIKQNFWDSLKSRNTHFEILSNNHNSNLQKLIESKRDEIFNN